MAKAKTKPKTEKKTGPTPPKAAKTAKTEKAAKAAAAKAAKAEEARKAKEAAEADRDRLLRLQADFENFRKRTIRERNETYRRANEDLMEEVLPVLDHMELALDAAQKHAADEAIVEGFRLVSEQLRAALGKFGLTPIDATEAEFDHNIHEAISHLPSPDVPENHVIAMTRRGYKLGDALLRAAQVVVSSGDPSAPAAEAEPAPVEEEAAPADEVEQETEA
jgi:molecular chaperone GrpE